MDKQNVWAPVGLVLAGDLPASTKLVWLMLAQPEPERPMPLHTRAGIDRRTMLTGLARLEAAGWLPPGSAPGVTPGSAPGVTSGSAPGVTSGVTSGSAGVARLPLGPFCVRYPTALLSDSRLSPQARVLFGQLQAIGPFRCRTGTFTYQDLTQRFGIGRDSLRAAAAELVKSGWLILSQATRKQPIHFTLGNPAWADDPVAVVRHRIKRGQFRGETIMREYLTLLVGPLRCEDDAAPWFLVNPWTGEYMELDRYYESAKVAFEFQGAQHYEETDQASWTDVVKQVGRDAMKARICRRFGVQLVVVHADDLSLAGMQAKVGSLLPQRSLTDEDRPLIQLLEDAAERYRSEWPSVAVR